MHACAAALLTIAIFPKPIATLSILYLALGDPIASLFGILYGGKGPRFRAEGRAASVVLEPDEIERTIPEAGFALHGADDPITGSPGLDVEDPEPLDHASVRKDVAAAEELIPAADAEHEGSASDRIANLSSTREDLASDDALHAVRSPAEHDDVRVDGDRLAATDLLDADAESTPLGPPGQDHDVVPITIGPKQTRIQVRDDEVGHRSTDPVPSRTVSETPALLEPSTARRNPSIAV